MENGPQQNKTHSRSRARMNFNEEASQATHDAGRATANITDTYYQPMLDEIETRLARLTSPGHNVPSARLSVISMEDAISASKEPVFDKRQDLSSDQKALIRLVADERKTPEGRARTQRLSSQLLVADNDMESKDSGERSQTLGAYLQDSPFIFLSTQPQKDQLSQPRWVLLHEETHDLQNTMHPKPKGLSSFDEGLWESGMEGIAWVTTISQQRKSDGLPSLKDDKKREIFAQKLADSLDLANTSRTDGRKLTVSEFESAFGTIPGNESAGNFLVGGKYRDVAEIYKPVAVQKSWTSSNAPPPPTDLEVRANRLLANVALAEASQRPIKYKDLPGATLELRRFETADRTWVAYVPNKLPADKADRADQVTIYRKKALSGGEAYVQTPVTPGTVVGFDNGARFYGNNVSDGHTESCLVVTRRENKISKVDFRNSFDNWDPEAKSSMSETPIANIKTAPAPHPF